MPKDDQIPASYYCSISGQIMIDPVFTADGYTYEREEIENWLQTHDTSPQTNERLEHKNLTINRHMRSDILGLLSKQPELYDKGEVYLPKSWVAQLVVAIKSNEHEAVQRWLAKDRRLLTLKLEGDATALHLACGFSSPELVDALLKILKQRNQSIMPGTLGFKPACLNVLLDRALTNGDQAQCELLLELGAEVEQPEASTQNTLLHRMVIGGRVQAISWLLEHKAVLESRNFQGDTPLILSIKGDNKKLTDFLLFKSANPDIKNAQQKTPLCIAVEKGDTEAARLLLAHGADSSISWGTAQLNALHVASRQGDEKMLKYLLQTQAATLIDVQDANGDTPLHLAVYAGLDSIIFLLLKAGAYHKIKNEQDQTPGELARAQQKPKLANFMVQTVRGLKKAKLEETARLHQVVAKQASEIANLKTALQNQGQGFKVQLSGMQQINEKLMADMGGMQAKIARLEPPLQPVTSSSPTLMFAPSSPLISFHIPAAAPNVNQKEVEEFLRLVAEGEQDKAEAMLKSNPALALVPGDVTDLSKRTFNNITGFQYAVWALDWHMWTMIRKYLSSDEAELQAQGFETGTWVRQHGVHANLNTLIQAYQTTIDLYNAGKSTEGDSAWVKQVGGEQLLLPTHVANEYCHPTRPFYPLPNFKDPASLPRSRTLDRRDWYTLEHDGGKLGEKLAAGRGTRDAARLCCAGALLGESIVSHYDANSVRELNSARTVQRDELITELRPRETHRLFV